MTQRGAFLFQAWALKCGQEKTCAFPMHVRKRVFSSPIAATEKMDSLIVVRRLSPVPVSVSNCPRSSSYFGCMWSNLKPGTSQSFAPPTMSQAGSRKHPPQPSGRTARGP